MHVVCCCSVQWECYIHHLLTALVFVSVNAVAIFISIIIMERSGEAVWTFSLQHARSVCKAPFWLFFLLSFRSFLQRGLHMRWIIREQVLIDEKKAATRFPLENSDGVADLTRRWDTGVPPRAIWRRFGWSSASSKNSLPPSVPLPAPPPIARSLCLALKSLFHPRDHICVLCSLGFASSGSPRPSFSSYALLLHHLLSPCSSSPCIISRRPMGVSNMHLGVTNHLAAR